MADLICEGACNPTIWRFDSAAEAYGEYRAQGIEAIPEALMATLLYERRLLHYTEHRHVGGNRWACGHCGFQRRYGPAPLSVSFQFPRQTDVA